MAAIDPSQFHAVHKFFPQLTRTQCADGFMFSKWIPTSTIAELRGVSENSVKESLSAVRKKMGLTSTNAMSIAIELTATLEMWSSFQQMNHMMKELTEIIRLMENK